LHLPRNVAAGGRTVQECPPVSQFLGLDRQGGEGYDQSACTSADQMSLGGPWWRPPADPESSTVTPESVDPVVWPGGAMAPVAGASPPPVRALQPSASYSITMRVRQGQRPGAFARVAGAIGETGAILGAIDLVRVVGGAARLDAGRHVARAGRR
jgi:hypothetical protein